MKVYVLDYNGHYVDDENHSYQYVEITPCEECLKFKWSDEDKKAIEKATKLVYVLAHYNYSLFVEQGGYGDSSGWRYKLRLGGLINPICELPDFDSQRIELLLGVIKLAAFAGPSYIDLRHLVKVYRACIDFIRHLHNDHRKKLLEVSKSPFDTPTKEEMVPIAPMHWFRTDLPLWISLDELLYFLPSIRGKSYEQINSCLDNEWNGLPRCKTCTRVLGFCDHNEKNGSCHSCNSAASNSGDDKTGCKEKKDI